MEVLLRTAILPRRCPGREQVCGNKGDGVLRALEDGIFVAGLDRIAMYRRGRADWPARRAVESERP
jgi:hypothetical protein